MKMNILVPAVISILLGGFLTFAAIKTWVRSGAGAKMPVTKGEVLNVELISRAAVNRGSETRTAGFEWVLRAKYTYEVDGKVYEGQRISNLAKEITSYDKKNDEGEAMPPAYIKEMYDILKSNVKQNVHYRASKPEYSYLFYQKSSVLRNIMMVGIGLMLLIPGIVLLKIAI